jgi:hypothetical protein
MIFPTEPSLRALLFGEARPTGVIRAGNLHCFKEDVIAL